ncbi:MAG: Verru_Chthon cassette protein B [Verrucomicrobiaceae bacterium]|nr:MAG: Verru_Chthon cassette protein B [Verrucomicrobiaceae bacterium]
MHACSPSVCALGHLQPNISCRSRRAGFSLVEVTMAIGVISFAFVALLGLLPAGMSNFRAAIDTNNETRILQSITGKVQLMDFIELPNLDFATSNEIFYFDEEGSPTDTSLREVESLKLQRIYAAKVFIEESQERNTDDLAKTLNFSTNVVVVFANLNSPAAKEFAALEDMANVKELLARKKGRTDVRIRPVLVSKMDGVRL